VLFAAAAQGDPQAVEELEVAAFFTPAMDEAALRDFALAKFPQPEQRGFGGIHRKYFGVNPNQSPPPPGKPIPEAQRGFGGVHRKYFPG
jgi:hypothetical protein